MMNILNTFTYFLVVCKAGRYRNVNTQTCDECPKGRYKEDIGNDQCNLCGTFETTVDSGSTSANECGEHPRIKVQLPTV